MTTIIQNDQLGTILFGKRVDKATGTLAATTIPLFTITGQVWITASVGVVTTAITVANSYKLQHNPTTGTTSDMFAATDIGTTDTPAGSVLGFQGLVGDSLLGSPGKAPSLKQPLFLTAGQIESVSAGTDGAITWSVWWVPAAAGGLLVAA